MMTTGAILVGALASSFVLVCLFMLLVILIQKPRGGGLSGAFGGAGGSAQAAFGAKTGDVLTWFTVVCFAFFLLLSMGLQWAIQADLATNEGPGSGDAVDSATTRPPAAPAPGGDGTGDSFSPGAPGLGDPQVDQNAASVPVGGSDSQDAQSSGPPADESPTTSSEP